MRLMAPYMDFIDFNLLDITLIRPEIHDFSPVFCWLF
jgi:hypothetical protein